MGIYVRKHRLFPVALSTKGAADSLSLRVAKVAAAVKSGALKSYRHGNQRRILVVDLIEWVRSWERVK
jgi:excisionase family DNA binding protein